MSFSDYDGELEYFNYNYEGINLFQSGTESVTVTLDLDYIEVPEEIIEEDSDSEDIKEEIKDEIIDVNPQQIKYPLFIFKYFRNYNHIFII